MLSDDEETKPIHPYRGDGIYYQAIVLDLEDFDILALEKVLGPLPDEQAPTFRLWGANSGYYILVAEDAEPQQADEPAESGLRGAEAQRQLGDRGPFWGYSRGRAVARKLKRGTEES